MKPNKEINCPCHSGSLYKNCCKPFHQGLHPKNALQLMRSRYAAYSLNLPSYIIETTHPDHQDHLMNPKLLAQEISNFSKNTTFTELEIIDFYEKNDTAVVIFKAHLKHDGHDASFSEKSFFEKIHDKWYYLRGEIPPQPTELNIFK